jgi:hypothetical protein
MILCKHRGTSAGCIKTKFAYNKFAQLIWHCSDGYTKRDEIGGAQIYSLHLDVTQVEGRHGKKALVRSGSGWEDNIKSYIKGIACEGVY